MTDTTTELPLPELPMINLGDDTRGVFTPEQIAQLLRPINPRRVLQAQGHSHVSQQDIAAHLIRTFGFGSFDVEVTDVTLVFETNRTNNSGEPTPKWDVCYRAMIRLTVRNPDGKVVTKLENGSTATAQNQSRGDGHDLAYKSAISLSVKRAAIFLGDQFGLSLYNRGQVDPLVMGTIVGGPEREKREDVQEGVKQQVSLGNDEVDRPMALDENGESSEPAATAVPTAKSDQIGKAPAGWLRMVKEATWISGSKDSLMGIHEQADRDGWLTEDVIKALGEQKAILQNAPPATPTQAQQEAGSTLAAGFDHPQAQQ